MTEASHSTEPEAEESAATAPDGTAKTSASFLPGLSSLRGRSWVTGLGIALWSLCTLLGIVVTVHLVRNGLPDNQPVSTAAGSNSERKIAPVAVQIPAEPERAQAITDPEEIEKIEAELARTFEEPLVHQDEVVRQTPLSREAALQAALPSLPVLLAPGETPPDPPPWRQYAVPVVDTGSQPMIAIVIDDLGLNRRGALQAIDLPPPLTLAFMTYAEGLDTMAASARERGHELMLHMPMEPRDPSYDPGPNVLAAELTTEELRRRVDWDLDRFSGYVGINNHMGSKFTASAEGMQTVMQALRARGLLYLDSLTSGASVGAIMAQRAGVPYAVRDVFLDNAPGDINTIYGQLAVVESLAQKSGYAVAIGHPHKATLKALATWLPQARERGFAIVPISAIVRHRQGTAIPAGG